MVLKGQNMFKPDQASKEAWNWVDNTEPNKITIDHLRTAYRLKLKACKLWGCKKNCKLNPRCLSGLGERIWQEDVKPNEGETEDPCNILRTPGNFVGLTNLGATCYVNSLLQLWFHNPTFRNAIYGWNPLNDPSEKDNLTLGNLNEGGFIPSSPIGHLQLLFSLMQFSKRSCVNPTSFIASLGLDTTTQQDAQEFSKLFICMLEERLSYQANADVVSMVQKQFQGNYEYVTRCSKCQNESTSMSPFYELDLSLGSKMHVTLSDSLNEFLNEEKLEGHDQYYCDHCASKQNATRNIRLRQLPPVLNIQLLRFVFDRKTGHKKKVSSSVHFPEVLDMTSYVLKAECHSSNLTYDLSAVLIHRGPSAYSGHYIAHIRDFESGNWYKFNDEVVQKLEGKNLKLGIEDDIEESKKVRQTKVAKGAHASSNAYMLVYYRRDLSKTVGETKANIFDGTSKSTLPVWLQKAIQCENDNFEAWIGDICSRKNESLKISQEKRDNMRRLYEKLPCSSLENGEFVATQWLSDWLSDKENFGPINNTKLLCRHLKTDPEKYREYKYISSCVAECLYNKYGGNPRLKSDSVCWDCVRTKHAALRLRSQLDLDSRTVANLLKMKIEPNEEKYWIGKDSIRSWKRLVLERLEFHEGNSTLQNSQMENEGFSTQDVETSFNEKNSSSSLNDLQAGLNNGGNENGGVNNVIVGDTSYKLEQSSTEWQAEFLKSLQERPSSASSVELSFNDDILCPHGNLCVQEAPRKLIQAAVWKIFRRYFPKAPEFRSTDLPCELCTRMADEAIRKQELYKQMAAEQRSVLLELFRQKNRPNFNRESVNELYVLGKEVIENWRSFIRDPGKKEPVLSALNAALLCRHGGLLHRPSTVDEDIENKFVYLWPAEWNTILKFMTVDTVIIVRKSVVNGNILLDSEPAVCETCLTLRLEEERRSQLHYNKAVIYVRQVCPNDPSQNKNAAQMDVDLSPVTQAPGFECGDPDFQVVSAAKKPRMDLTPNSNLSQQARRSQRQRRVRGEKEIIVSSDQTLRELKVEVMKKFRIPPFDQHLICNGQDLSDNQASLGSLGIYPGAVIILKADEPTEDPSLIDDYARTSYPEEGFKGTELLRN